MKTILMSLLLMMTASCAHIKRSPSSVYVSKGQRTDQIVKSMTGVIIKYNDYNMGKAYYETMNGQCVVYGADKVPTLSCNNKVIARKSEVEEVIKILKGSVLVYSGYNMGKAYYDIQGGVLCTLSNGKSDGGKKNTSFQCN